MIMMIGRMASKRDEDHLPEPQKGAIARKREAVKLELAKGGGEERGRQGGPTQMGEVQRLGMNLALITIDMPPSPLNTNSKNAISVTSANNTMDITIIKNTISITNAKKSITRK